MFVADAHRDDGKRFVVRAEEKLTAFLELENALGSDFDERFDKCRISSSECSYGHFRCMGAVSGSFLAG